MGVHLHVHTEHSVLDGQSKIDNLVKHVSDIGQEAVAISDHGTLAGAYNFHKAAKSAGVKPVIGMEAYLADDMFTKDRTTYHLLLLAHNRQGYDNLVKLSSIAQTKGFYYRPRIDIDLLSRYSDGLIATSTCAAGEVISALKDSNLSDDKKKTEAYAALARYADIFGDRFFIELQPNSFHSQFNPFLIDAANYFDINLIATTDAHYVKEEDYRTHDTLLCMQTGASKNQSADDRGLVFTENEFWAMPDSVMLQKFRGVEEAWHNTSLVADAVEHYDIASGEYHIPSFTVPEGYTEQSFFLEIVDRGLQRLYGDKSDTDVIQRRKEKEIGIIKEMGFISYFLIVWDICQYSESQGIHWNVRGSGAGSIVAYAMGITEIDPIKSDLIFERFLNPARVSMPDFDIDFPDKVRDKMFDYLVMRYGSSRVAAISTSGKMHAKGAWRDTARVYDVPLEIVNDVSNIFGKDVQSQSTSIAEHLKDEELVKYIEENNVYKPGVDYTLEDVFSDASRLEGTIRSNSIHAAGVLLTERAVSDYIPLSRLPGSAHGNTLVDKAGQYDMGVCEKMGLLKIDFLAIKTLSVIDRACELIKERHNVDLSFNDIPYRHDNISEEQHSDLDRAFELLQDGNTAGIFQVEAAGMQDVLVRMKPEKFEHIVACISLYRPGPMENIPSYIDRMHNREPVNYHHPDLEPILEETYGIIVYQEQLMRIASDLFGYTPGEADTIRKAVSKKKLDELMAHRQRFLDAKNGMSHNTKAAIWHDYEDFARYGFNKAHASDYALMTVRTAYLKAHYPYEYIAALLSAYYDDSDRFSRHINECRSTGINILPPDINRSGYDFQIEETAEGVAIRYGFENIKFCGRQHFAKIIAERSKNGSYKSIGDFVNRVKFSSINKRALEHAIKVGVFDSLGVARDDMLRAMSNMKKKFRTTGKLGKALKVKGQRTIFDAGVSAPEIKFDIEDYIDEDEPRRAMRDYLNDEKEFLGMYVSARPTDRFIDYMRSQGCTPFSELPLDDIEEARSKAGHSFYLGGEIVRVSEITTKKGKKMAFLDLEDAFSMNQLTLVCFPDFWKENKSEISEGLVVVANGSINLYNNDVSIIANNIDATTDKDVDVPELVLDDAFDLSSVEAEGYEKSNEKSSEEDNTEDVQIEDSTIEKDSNEQVTNSRSKIDFGQKTGKRSRIKLK